MPLVSKNFSDIITFTRASSATFTGSDGLIQSATTNTPRFDYDPVTLAAKGLLIEEQRTNLFLYSQEFATTWSKSGCTVADNALVSPDGGINATLVTTSSTVDSVTQSVSVTTGITYTLSVYLKAGTSTANALLFLSTNSAFATTQVNFDLTAGTASVAVGTPVDYGITPVGNGWFKCFVVATATATATSQTRFASTSANAVDTYAIWGAQLEAGSFPTSYIPTVASQVTRSADVASVNTLSPWYNATEGTLYAEGSGLSSAGNRLASLDPGPSNLMYVTLAQTTVTSGGVSQASFSYSPVANTTYKQALAYKANDFAAARDGTVATDTSGTVPSVSKLSIGSIDSTALFTGSGHIRRITYYPRRLTNAELQAITA